MSGTGLPLASTSGSEKNKKILGIINPITCADPEGGSEKKNLIFRQKSLTVSYPITCADPEGGGRQGIRTPTENSQKYRVYFCQWGLGKQNLVDELWGG